jgi:PAS domain S-box-containing protein
LAAIAAATQPLVEPFEIMNTTARLLAEHLGVDRCAYAEVENESCFVITGDYALGVPSIVGRWPVAAFGPGCVRCMLAGEPYIVDDVEAHREIGPEHLPAYRATTIRAVICLPLHKDGRFTAAMAVHQTYVRHWTPDEIELVGLVVARCWEALERSRVLRALRESEARYRIMVEASPECVNVVAPDGRLLQMNAAGLRILDAFDETQVLGHSMYDWIVPEHREAFRAFNERVCRGENGILGFGIVSLSGVRRSMETTAVPLPSAAGGFNQLAVTRDVTARVAAEQALAESRGRLDYAVRLSGIGFWYCDLPFEELIWDEQVRSHFFLTREVRVTLEIFFGRIHPDDRLGTERAINESIANHIPYDIIYRTLHPDTGAIKWIRALGGSTYDADGSPVRFDGVTVDVSAQKLDQERLAHALERERAQARLLGKVAAAALTIHGASSLDGVLSTVAEEAKNLIGAHRAVTTLRAAHVETGRAHAPADEENRVLAVPLMGRSGRILGLVELFDKINGDFDETDRAILVQLAQIAAIAVENTSLNEQLREQDRRKDEFLATLAHELRNPLAPIRTGLHVLRMTSDAAQAQKTREMMERQLGHMVRMVDDLLDVSRITLGKVKLTPELTDFRSVLHSAVETTRSMIEAAGHEFAVRLPKEPLPLHVDSTRLSQVFANLLNNAAKYTPPQGRIQLSAEVESDLLVVRVSDSGLGIPKDMLPKVFDMFTQVGHSIDRSQGGLGIGLTLVRRLVEMHGGSVEADSAGANSGSTFTVRLPLAGSDKEQDGAASIASVPPGPVALRVLVVDDNVDGAEALAMLLELNGHQARLAHDGREALSAAAEFRPHVVFLDIGLPEMNGYEVARTLRAQSLTPEPTLVALTGWGTEEDRRQAQSAGFDRHLVKPVDTTKVMEVLKQAMRGTAAGDHQNG